MHCDNLIMLLVSLFCLNQEVYAVSSWSMHSTPSNGLENLIRSFASSLSIFVLQEASCPGTIATSRTLSAEPSAEPSSYVSWPDLENSSTFWTFFSTAFSTSFNPAFGYFDAPSRSDEYSSTFCEGPFSALVIGSTLLAASSPSDDAFDSDIATITSSIIVSTITISNYRTSRRTAALASISAQESAGHPSSFQTRRFRFTATAEKSMPQTDALATDVATASPGYDTRAGAQVSDRLLSLIFAVTSALDDAKIDPTAIHSLLDAFDSGLYGISESITYPTGSATDTSTDARSNSTPSSHSSLQLLSVPSATVTSASTAMTTKFTTEFWAEVEHGRPAENQVFANQIASKIYQEKGSDFLHGLKIDDIAKDIADQINKQITKSAHLAEVSVLRSLLGAPRYTSPS